MQFIYHDQANSAGLYKISNSKNGRLYIGSTYRFKKRGSDHFRHLKANRHPNKFLQSDWNKCGPDVFVFEVVEIIQDKEKRLEAEERLIQLHFDRQKQCYNATPSAHTREGCGNQVPRPPPSMEWRIRHSEVMTGRKQSPETIAKRVAKILGRRESEAQKEKRRGKPVPEERRERIRAAQKGQKKTPEQIEKNRLSHLGKKHTEEAKEKVRAFNLGRSHSMESKQKMRDLHQEKKVRGERVSFHPPFGYRFDGGLVFPVLSEQETISRILELHQSSLPLTEITRVLNDEGRRVRNGERWRVRSVLKIVLQKVSVTNSGKMGWAIAKIYEDNTAIGHGLGISSGDTFLLKMSSGRVGLWRVLKIDYYMDPRDMFKAKIELFGYKE